MKRFLRYSMAVAGLVVLWLLAWGEVSPGRVIAGIAVAVGLLIAFPSDPRPVGRPRPKIHVVPSLKLVWYVLTQLVTSNILVAREIITPGSGVKTGVLAHPLDDASDEAMSLIANIIALTPGTMTVELTKNPNVLYVHFLLLDDVDAARRSISHLEALVCAAVASTQPASAADHSIDHSEVPNP